MRGYLRILGLILGFGEALLFLAFATEDWPNLPAMAIQSLPGLGVALAAALGIRWPRVGGVMLLGGGLGLTLLWALRLGASPGWAYLIMPGGLAVAGLLLLAGAGD